MIRTDHKHFLNMNVHTSYLVDFMYILSNEPDSHRKKRVNFMSMKKKIVNVCQQDMFVNLYVNSSWLDENSGSSEGRRDDEMRRRISLKIVAAASACTWETMSQFLCGLPLAVRACIVRNWDKYQLIRMKLIRLGSPLTTMPAGSIESAMFILRLPRTSVPKIFRRAVNLR